MDKMTSMGSVISARRKALGMTQESLAGELGVTNQAVSKWEMDANCPDIQLLPALADVLNISIDALFGREKASAEPAGGLPWPDDDNLRAVAYIGHSLKSQKNLDDPSRGRISEFTFEYEGKALNVASVFSVKCGDISGNAAAGGNIYCSDVGSNASAGGTLKCGDISGNAAAGGDINCGNIGGHAIGKTIYRK